jgi:hypothetical protein
VKQIKHPNWLKKLIQEDKDPTKLQAARVKTEQNKSILLRTFQQPQSKKEKRLASEILVLFFEEVCDEKIWLEVQSSPYEQIKNKGAKMHQQSIM